MCQEEQVKKLNEMFIKTSTKRLTGFEISMVFISNGLIKVVKLFVLLQV